MNQNRIVRALKLPISSSWISIRIFITYAMIVFLLVNHKFELHGTLVVNVDLHSIQTLFEYFHNIHICTFRVCQAHSDTVDISEQ